MKNEYIIPDTHLIALLTIVTIIGIFVGAVISNLKSRGDAINHNAAYYNPTNQEFTWRTNTPVKVQF